MTVDSDLYRQMQSTESRRFQWVHEQGFDTSCGYASVASLLELYWDVKTSEKDLLSQIPPAESDRFSLSLADARRMIESAGLEARGYRMSWVELLQVAAAHAPVLVHYDRPRKHFALLLGIDRDRVVVADPARGLEVLSQNDFLGRWSGAALFVGSTLHTKNSGALEAAVDAALARAHRLERTATNRPMAGP